MADISLSDHYVVLLQDVVNQTKLLRDEIKNNKTKENSALESISQKVDGLARTVTTLTMNGGRRVRQTGGHIKVPKMCSVSILKFLDL